QHEQAGENARAARRPEEQVAVVAEHGEDGDLHAVAPVLNQEIPHADACLRPMSPAAQEFRGLEDEFRRFQAPSPVGLPDLTAGVFWRARRWSKASIRLSSAIAAGKVSGSKPVLARPPGSSSSWVTAMLCQTP